MQQQGVIETIWRQIPQLAQFEVRPQVWDAAMIEVFDPPAHVVPPPVQAFLFELEVGTKTFADFPRAGAISDRDYAEEILRRLVKEFRDGGKAHALLMADDNWDYDPQTGRGRVPN